MKEVVDHLAGLVRLVLSPEETQDIVQYLQDMQEFITILNNVPMSEEELMAPYSTEVSLRLREDIAGNMASIDELVALAPDFSDGGYVVPRIMDECS